MTLKLAMLALALLVAWFVLFRPRRKPVPRQRRQVPPPTALEACPRCGVYRLPDGDCACEPPSTAAR